MDKYIIILIIYLAAYISAVAARPYIQK